jgi:hypothetical protein
VVAAPRRENLSSGATAATSPGTRERAPRRAAPARSTGGFTFAEDPELGAPDARIIWHAELDPGTLAVTAVPTGADDPDGIRVADLARWLTVAAGPSGEHAVLSDGWRRIRLDIEAGRFADADTIRLHYDLHGTVSAERRILPLRRFLHLCRYRRFSRALFPPDPRMKRLLAVLRVHDALAEGASQREIGAALFGEERIRHGWSDGSDSLRSRVRRLVREARAMAAGGYRLLMRRGR